VAQEQEAQTPRPGRGLSGAVFRCALAPDNLTLWGPSFCSSSCGR